MKKQSSIRQIGNSLGTTLPKDMLDRMHLEKGDPVFIVETAHGLLVTPYDPDFAEAMELYGEGAADYRNALRELAR